MATPEESLSLRTVQVFYGTNRARTSICAGWAGTSWDDILGCLPNNFYGKRSATSDQGDELEVGTFTVSFPPDHEVGLIERPPKLLGVLSFRAENPAEDVVIWRLDSFANDHDAWARRVDATEKSQAVVYVHGYATSFEDAARRAAQLAFDLDLDIDLGAVPMVYSWPSEGTPTAYVSDLDASEHATEPFLRFLDLVRERTAVERVHVVAHSMGNRLVTKALRDRALELGEGSDRVGDDGERMIDQLILAAPDVWANHFKDRFLQVLPRMARRVTLYVSDKDLALTASEGLRDGRPRAGQRKGGLLETVLAGFDSVDASDLDTGFLSHSYYANNDSVLSDLYCLLKGHAPRERPLLHPRSAGLNWEFLSGSARRVANAAGCLTTPEANEPIALLARPTVELGPQPQRWSALPWLLLSLAVVAALAVLWGWRTRGRRSS